MSDNDKITLDVLRQVQAIKPGCWRQYQYEEHGTPLNNEAYRLWKDGYLEATLLADAICGTFFNVTGFTSRGQRLLTEIEQR